MRRILAIAAISIRSAIRSRMVICLLALLAIAVVGLPLTVKGDGTAEGQLRIIITYSLGAAFALLALTSLWAGALSIAQEVEEKQIQMLAVKPVRRVEIWIGKWIGLMAINAVLLLAASLITAALLPRDLLDAQSAEGGNWRAVHRPVSPLAEDRESDARALLAERMRSGAYPPDAPAEAALRMIRQELIARAATVSPGRRRDWSFELPRPVRADETLRIRFRASSSQMNLAAVRGQWIAGPDSASAAWRQSISFIPGTYQELELPGAPFAGARAIALSFLNEDPAHTTLVFDPSDGARILLPSGGFYANYARALFLLLLRLGFLAAVGVTAGALFSSPVALFMAVALLLMAQLAGYTAEFPVSSTGPLKLLDLTGDALRVVLKPLNTPPVLDAVATGMRVETAWILRVLGIQLALYGGFFAAFGATVLARRELALPQA